MAEQTLFKYRGKDSTGKIISGESSASSAHALRQELRNKQIQIEDIQELRSKANAAEHPFFQSLQNSYHAYLRDRRRSERADLYDSMATMMNAGLPLEGILHQLSQSEQRSQASKRMLLHMRNAVREGISLASAAKKHGDWFGPVECALLEAGQHAGDLSGIFQQLRHFQQDAAKQQHSLITALLYPCLLAFAALGVLLFLSTNTLPELAAMLHEADKQVPWITNAMILFGQGLIDFWPVVFLLGFSALALFPKALRKILSLSDNYPALLILPILPALKNIQIARFTQILERLLHNGIPLNEALQVCAETASNPDLKSKIYNSSKMLLDGKSFAHSLDAEKLGDKEFIQLIELAEQSGELAQMLENISDRYQRSAERSIQLISSLVEPLSIILLAIIIGIIAISAILPLTSLS